MFPPCLAPVCHNLACGRLWSGASDRRWHCLKGLQLYTTRNGPVLCGLRATVVPMDCFAAAQRTGEGAAGPRVACRLGRSTLLRSILELRACAVLTISSGSVAFKRKRLPCLPSGYPWLPVCPCSSLSRLQSCRCWEKSSVGVGGRDPFLAPSFIVHGFECSQTVSI